MLSINEAYWISLASYKNKMFRKIFYRVNLNHLNPTTSHKEHGLDAIYTDWALNAEPTPPIER